MVTLPNGYRFRWVASAGALGWAGRDEGHGLARLWKLIFRLTGRLKTDNLAFFTKTVTLLPVDGHLTLARPWRAVRLWRGGAVNSVALTNPGIAEWAGRYYPLCLERGLRTFLSLRASTAEDMEKLARFAARNCPRLEGLELDLSCGNVGPATSSQKELLAAALFGAGHLPVGVKLGAQDDIPSLLRSMHMSVAWFHLINAVPWKVLYPAKSASAAHPDGLFAASAAGPWYGGLVKGGADGPPSPLATYGYDGAVSGPEISALSRHALRVARRLLPDSVQVISGGGVMDAWEARLRFDMGADAVGLGTVILRNPAGVWKLVADTDGMIATAGLKLEEQS